MTWNQVKFDTNLNRGFGSLIFFLTPQPRGLDGKRNTWEEVIHACRKESPHAWEEVKRSPAHMERKSYTCEKKSIPSDPSLD